MTDTPVFTYDDPAKRLASKMEAITFALSNHIDPGVKTPPKELIHQLFLIMDDGQTGKDIAAVLGHTRPVEICEVIDPEEEAKKRPIKDQ